MKKTFTFITILMILVSVILSGSPALAAEAPADPSASVTLLMEEIVAWDTENATEFLSGLVPQEYVANIGEIILPSMLSRLSYRVGNAKISGSAAEVDIEITAADIKNLMGDIVAEAVGCAAISRITGIPLNIESYVTERLEKAMTDESLTTIKTHSTVYLVASADGAWNLDITDIRNFDFLEALTGGMAAFEEPLRSLFFGITG